MRDVENMGNIRNVENMRDVENMENINIKVKNQTNNQNDNSLFMLDAETLSRAILTFCLDGADAIMYTLILGAPNASSIVQKLRMLTVILCEKYNAICKNENMQLELLLDEKNTDAENTDSENTNVENTNHYENELSTEENESEIIKDDDYYKKQTAEYRLIKSIEGNPHLKILEQYFHQGLISWGYVNANNSKSLITLHRSVIRWCMRLSHLPSWDVEKLISWFTVGGSQWIIAPNSKYWPNQLQDLALHGQWAPPLCLWGLGNPEALSQCKKPIAIVGSRGCDDYGREIAGRIAYDSSLKGHTVISGGAMGIDAAAHWGSLDARSVTESNNTPSGCTVAVFAGGLNNKGPHSNETLFKQIINNGGACISELCPNTTPIARRFLIRNRIIAALSSKVIVAQARIRSGALNTALWASNLNRELYAVPGDITSPHNTGCNELIHDGKAIMICSFSDIESIYPTKHAMPKQTDAQDKKADEELSRNTLDSNKLSENSESNYENSADSSSYNLLQKYILKGIAICRKQRVTTTMDAVYNATVEIIKKDSRLCKTNNLSDNTANTTNTANTANTTSMSSINIPSIAEFSGIITLLEINGVIKRNNESILIVKK